MISIYHLLIVPTQKSRLYHQVTGKQMIHSINLLSILNGRLPQYKDRHWKFN